MSFTISLPIESRRASCDFYSKALEREPFGALADDGMPEPLQFKLGQSATLMLVPTDGFGWVVGSERLAPRGASECLLSVNVADSAAVEARYQTAIAAGAKEIEPPSQKPWGYSAMFADPDGHLWMIVAT